MKYLEDKVQQSIVQYLKYHRFLFTCTGAGLIKNQKTQIIMQRLGYTKGTPDLIVFIKGGTLGIECKKPTTYKISSITNKRIIASSGGVQSQSQKDFQKKLEEISGHFYLVATSVTDVDNFIKKNNIKSY